jgi:hypothetical protein
MTNELEEDDDVVDAIMAMQRSRSNIATSKDKAAHL